MHELAETDKARKKAKQELKEVKSEVLIKRDRLVSFKHFTWAPLNCIMSRTL